MNEIIAEIDRRLAELDGDESRAARIRRNSLLAFRAKLEETDRG